jgi:hypothetical protein
VKWFVDLDDRLRIVAALARALDLLQLPRYAAIGRSAATREVLSAYETSLAHGKAAFRRAAPRPGSTPGAAKPAAVSSPRSPTGCSASPNSRPRQPPIRFPRCAGYWTSWIAVSP